MNRITSRLTYANVISSLCLFLLLGGGTAVALNGANTVFSDDIVNGQVREPDLAKLAFTAVNPNPVTATDPCASGQVGVFCGQDSMSGLRGWRNLGAGRAGIAYARDGLGIVHLRGTMIQSSASPPLNDLSFILPSAYRPAAVHEFVVAYGQSNTCSEPRCDYRHAVVQVRPNGNVTPLSAQPGAGGENFSFSEGVSLDGVEFRAK
jgi:hypothetical protein